MADTRQYTNLNIIVQRGVMLDDNNAVFNVVDNNGDDINLSGYDSGKLEVKRAFYSSSNILEFSTTDGSLILGDGSFQLLKDDSGMDVDEGGYYYIMTVTTLNKDYPVVKGIFTVIG